MNKTIEGIKELIRARSQNTNEVIPCGEQFMKEFDQAIKDYIKSFPTCGEMYNKDQEKDNL